VTGAPAAGISLEAFMRDILESKVQAWLDDHLEGIVERLVREEIRRRSGDGGED